MKQLAAIKARLESVSNAKVATRVQDLIDVIEKANDQQYMYSAVIGRLENDFRDLAEGELPEVAEEYYPDFSLEDFGTLCNVLFGEEE